MTQSHIWYQNYIPLKTIQNEEEDSNAKFITLQFHSKYGWECMALAEAMDIT